MKLRWSILIVLLVPMASLQAQPAALVVVDEVVEQQYTRTVPVLGRLVAKQSGNVASRIHGAVSEVLVQVGDVVSRGQVLAKIDTAALALQSQQAESHLAEAQSRLRTARAQLALASQEVKRLEELQGSAAVSKANYEDARQGQNIAYARVNEAEANISSSRTSLDIANLELSYADILAPFHGTITAKLTEVGNYLQQGQSVFQIISDKQLEVEADVPAGLLAGLSKNVVVDMLFENNTRHQARLRAIIPEENPRTRTRRVRFETILRDDSGRLASEQSATVFIPASAARKIRSVHKDGLMRRGQKDFVYLVRDNLAELRQVQAGEAVRDRVEIVDGLEPGDLVVVRGNERLAPGQVVQVSEKQ